MKSSKLFLTVLLFSVITVVFAGMLTISGCSVDGDPLVGNHNPPPSGVTVAKLMVNQNGVNMDVANGGTVTVAANIQVGFDASNSLGTITRYQWIFTHNGTYYDSANTKTFFRMFTTTPDSFTVKMKVWGQLSGDTSSVTFTLKIGTGPSSATEPYIISSTLQLNGKRIIRYGLPIHFIPNPPFNAPRVFGWHGVWGNGTPIAFDTTNGCYIFVDTLYDNGPHDICWAGTLGGSWAIPGSSAFKDPANPNLFLFDERAGVLMTPGQPALTPPGDAGDTSYLNGILRTKFTSSTITLLMNNRKGNCPVTSTPTYQYSTSTVGWTTMTQTMGSPANSTGWGIGTLPMTVLGTDYLLKIKILNGTDMSGSMFWIPADQCLEMIVVQPMSPGGTPKLLTLAEARSQGLYK